MPSRIRHGEDLAVTGPTRGAGLRQAKQPDGTTLYTGTIPDTSSDRRVNPADDTILRMITSLRSGNGPGARAVRMLT
jgi:hypothetical protein